MINSRKYISNVVALCVIHNTSSLKIDIFSRFLYSLVLSGLLAFGLSVLSFAQENFTTPTISDIEELEKSAELSTLTADEKNEALTQLKYAKQLLRTIEERATSVAAYVNAAVNAKNLIKEIEHEKSVIDAKQELSLASESLDNLKSRLAALIIERESIGEAIEDIQIRQTELIERPEAISKELITAHAELENIQEKLTSLNSNNEGLLGAVRTLILKTKSIERKAAIDDLQRELATISVRQPILSSRLALEQSRSTFIEKSIAHLQSKISDSRVARAEAMVLKAKEDIVTFKDSHTNIGKYAKENLTLAKKYKAITQQTTKAEEDITRFKNESLRMVQSSEIVQRVLSAGSITDDLGELLRHVRKGLPETSKLASTIEQNKKSTVREQLNVVLWQERLREISVVSDNIPDANAQFIIATESVNEVVVPNTEVPMVLIQARRVLLTDLIDAANTHVKQLTDERIILEKVLTIASSLKKLLDRHLLWLPTNTGLFGNLLGNLSESGKWLFSISNWNHALKDLLQGIKKNPIKTVFLLLLPFVFLFMQGMFKRALSRFSKRVGKVNYDNYWTTPLALVITVCLTLPIPLFIGVISSILAVTDSDSEFTLSLTLSLAAVSSLLWILILFRVMSRKEGLFKVHFGWTDQARQTLRANLYWFIGIQAIATFLFVMSVSSGLPEMRYGIGILSFLVSSIAISVFGFLLFKSKIIVSGNTSIKSVSPLNLIAFILLVSIPSVIGASSLFGYFDSAVELQSRVFQSGILVLVIMIIFGLLMRMSLISQRRFALKKAKERRIKVGSARIAASKAEESGEAVPIAIEPEIKVDAIGTQSKRILHIVSAGMLIGGLWLIWSQILPALGIINEIVLWQRNSLVDGMGVQSPVTLWNLVLTVLLITGGVIAARNIRGVLEIGIFQRFNLDPGTRYAAVTIAGYLLVGIGLVAGFSQLGLDWSKLQWIVAALGVGLGFGLQEIVANFVSGLIILFERPVRVGDIVSIGTLSGTVSNIKIRATTITDFDNLEVLLPNKSIITENVTNWTLNNTVTRLVLKIGVAYGSNIDKVRSLLKNVIDAHPDVLKTPPATVFFLSHGDSSLDFEIRIFVDTPGKRLPVTHDVTTAINAALENNGIEIPFPQRDVHLIPDAE